MNSLKSLLNDKTSGSIELTFKLNQILQEAENKQKIENILKDAEHHLYNFATVLNYISNVKKFLLSNNIAGLKKYIDDFEKTLSDSNNKIFKNAKPYLSKCNSFLTLSNSYTILQVLKKLNTINKIEVFVCESRPALEGKILSGNLVESNENAKVITDAEMSVFIPKVDAVILGADKILPNGNVINKAGSFSAALISHYYNKPIYVLADKSKYFRNDKNEKDNSITKIYFEEVPAKLITKIITD